VMQGNSAVRPTAKYLAIFLCGGGRTKYVWVLPGIYLVTLWDPSVVLWWQENSCVHDFERCVLNVGPYIK